ncbi:MAG: hypothetical protein HY674_19615 [Chloroflexi bacterium]|nr:hypothetical protein [Chloroflexota bacterium]
MKVLALAGDAGGARALVPVLKRLAATPDVVLQCQAYAAAEAIWRREGFAAAAPDLSAAFQCDRLLLGTSWQPEQWELAAIERVRGTAVKSVSLLDSWVNYRLRFINRNGELVLPDFIAVMDEQARQEMIAEGFPGARLCVTGHPGIEELERHRGPAAMLAARNRILSLLAGERPDLVFLFASQPLSQMEAAASWGFDERTVLHDLTAAVREVLQRNRQRGVLLIKPHPRERAPLAGGISGGEGPLRLFVVEDRQADYRELIAASDIVLGMNSNLLLEACLLEKPVLSYQPGLLRPDPLPSNRWGWSRPVYARADLEPALAEEIFDDTRRKTRKDLLGSLPRPRGAADQIVKLLMA